MKKNYFIYFILFFPILDFLTSIATWNQWVSIGLIVKGIFLGYACYYILKYHSNKKIWLFFLVLLFYGIGDLCYWYFKDSTAIFGEITNLFKIYYLPIFILFFSCYKTKIPLFVYFLLFLEFLLLYLVPYPFHLGHNISEIYPNKHLYLSYFYVGNELSNIFILLLPISFVYLFSCHKKWIFITFFLTIFMLALLGTKTMYLSVVLILLYFIYVYRKKFTVFFHKHFSILFLFFSCFTIFSIYFVPRSSIYQNIKTSLDYYEVDSFSSFLTLENIDHIVFSNRLTFLENVHTTYLNSTLDTKIFGLGRVKINQIKDIEIDLFDIFYSIGILGFFFYVLFFSFVLKYVKIKSVNKFTFWLLCLISLFTGHVLISPMTSTYLALLFGVKELENEELYKKSVETN